MINIKDLINRKYEGKQPIRFEYVLETEDSVQGMLDTICIFERDLEIPRHWKMYTMLRYSDGTSEAIGFEYDLPIDLPIDKVCSSGLFNLQMLLKERVQNLSVIDFMIGDKIADM